MTVVAKLMVVMMVMEGVEALVADGINHITANSSRINESVMCVVT